jgi:hypothetical protein
MFAPPTTIYPLPPPSPADSRLLLSLSLSQFFRACSFLFSAPSQTIVCGMEGGGQHTHTHGNKIQQKEREPWCLVPLATAPAASIVNTQFPSLFCSEEKKRMKVLEAKQQTPLPSPRCYDAMGHGWSPSKASCLGESECRESRRPSVRPPPLFYYCLYLLLFTFTAA